MEQFFKDFSYSSKNVMQEWTDSTNQYKLRKCLENLGDESQKANEVLKSAKLFFDRCCDDLHKSWSHASEGEREEREKLLARIFSFILDLTHPEKIKNLQNIESFMDLYNSVSKQKKYTLMKILCLIRLNNMLGYPGSILERLDETKMNQVFTGLEVILNSTDSYFNPTNSQWLTEVDRILSLFQNEALFMKNIQFLQKYFEYLISNSKQKNSHLRRNIDQIITVKNRQNKIQCKSLYFNLLSQEEKQADVKIHQLIELLKDILQHGNSYCPYSYEIFGRELSKLFEYPDNNTYKLFSRHAKGIYELVFSSIRDNPSSECSKELIEFFIVPMNDALAKCKTTNSKDFQAFVLRNLIEISQRLYANNSNTEQFFRVLSYFRRFISDIKDKSLSKPILDLVSSLMKFGRLDALEYAHSFSHKYDFFNFKNFPEETLQIIKGIFALASNSSSFDEKYAKELKEFSSDLIGKVKHFAKVVEALQPVLWDILVCKPIEDQIQSTEFYTIVMPLYELVSVKTIPSSNTDLNRLENVFRNSISDLILELVDPDSVKYYEQPADYYLHFYRLIAEAIKTREDIKLRIEKDLVTLFDKIISINKVIDELQPGGLSIYYFIALAFTVTIVSNKSFNAELVDKIITLWFNLKEDEPGNDNIEQMFSTMVQLTSSYHPQILARKAKKLWEYFFDEENTRDYLYPLGQIFSYNVDAFKGFEDQLFKVIVSSSDANSTIMLLNGIAQYLPEYFLDIDGDYGDKKTIRMFVLIDNGIKTANDSFLVSLISAFNMVISQISLKKSKSHLTRMFEQRGNLKPLFTYNNKLIPGFSALVVMHVNNYYNAMIEGLNETEKTRILLKEMLDVYDTMNGSKDTVHIFYNLKKIGESNQKRNYALVKELHKRVLAIKKSEKSGDLSEAITHLVDFIEGRSMENITNKLDQNIENVGKMGENLAQQDQKLTELDVNVSKQDKSLKGLKEKVTDLDVKVDEQAEKIQQLDEKTLMNMPVWCKQIRNSVINNNQDWVLIAQRLHFAEADIKAWFTQADPFLCMLQEWFIANKTSDAINGLLAVFKELHMTECVSIIETNLKKVELESLDIFKDKEIDDRIVNSPAQVFISFEWSSKKNAQLLRDKLSERLNKDYGLSKETNSNNRINIWFDDGKMGGGEKRNSRIDLGLRLSNVLICLITGETNKDQTMLNQINLAVQLNKPIIPLLLDSKLKWPPSGSLGPILSEYLFIRFFQRPPKELTHDERYWPVDKFEELVMQLKQLIPFTVNRKSIVNQNPKERDADKASPEVFISYQWDKQKQIIDLYEKLTRLGISCWLDIKQMGGGDSLYDKIDRGLRNCHVVVSIVTVKYGMSANCRKEIALADSLGKPIVPVVLDRELKYPPAGPMAPTLSTLEYLDFSKEDEVKWEPEKLNLLLERLKEHLPKNTVETVTSRACVIS